MHTMWENEKKIINADNTQRKDTTTTCYNKLNIGERDSEGNDERNGYRGDERNGDTNGVENVQGRSRSFGSRPSAETNAGSTAQRGWPVREQDPRRHITADLMREKPRWHRSHPIVVLYVSSVFSLSLSARTGWTQTSQKSAIRVTTAGKVLISNGRHPEVCGPVGLVRPNGWSYRVLELHQTCRWQCFLCWCFSASTPRVNDRARSIKRVWNKLSSGTTHVSVERCRRLWEDRRNRFPAGVWTSLSEAFSERFFLSFKAFSKKRRRVDCNRVSWLPPGEAWR